MSSNCISVSLQVKAIFNSIYSDAQSIGNVYQTKITRQDASGGYTDCHFSMFNIQVQDFSRNTNDLLQKFFGLSLCAARSSALREFQENMKSALLRDFVESYMIACVWDNGVQNIQSIFTNKTNEIAQWLVKEELEIRVRMRILTELPRRDIPSWKFDELSVMERTFIAHRSGISSDEFLSRLFHSSTFSRPLGRNETKTSLAEDVDKYMMALSLSLWRPMHLDDLWIEDSVWRNSPFIPFAYMRMHGAYKHTDKDASSVDFHSTMLDQAFPHQFNVNDDKFRKVEVLLNTKPELRYPLKRIFRGLYEVLSSTNEAEFVQESQAFDGLHDIFVGMDGFIGESPKKVGNRKYFEQVWRRVLDSLSFDKHPDANSNKKIISAIYNLRCELAHGTNSTIYEKVERLKRVLGDDYNRGSYDVRSLGFSLNSFLKKVFESMLEKEDFMDKLDEYKNALTKTGTLTRLSELIYSLFK